jgi:hypothetical protein
MHIQPRLIALERPISRAIFAPQAAPPIPIQAPEQPVGARFQCLAFGARTPKFRHRKSGMKSWVRLNIAPDTHQKMNMRSIRRSTQAASQWGLVPRWSLTRGRTIFPSNRLPMRHVRSLRGL